MVNIHLLRIRESLTTIRVNPRTGRDLARRRVSHNVRAVAHKRSLTRIARPLNRNPVLVVLTVVGDRRVSLTGRQRVQSAQPILTRTRTRSGGRGRRARAATSVRGTRAGIRRRGRVRTAIRRGGDGARGRHARSIPTLIHATALHRTQSGRRQALTRLRQVPEIPAKASMSLNALRHRQDEHRQQEQCHAKPDSRRHASKQAATRRTLFTLRRHNNLHTNTGKTTTAIATLPYTHYAKQTAAHHAKNTWQTANKMRERPLGAHSLNAISEHVAGAQR